MEQNNPADRLSMRPSWLLPLLFLLPLIVFCCFYNLDAESFHPGDESTHVRVTQEMLHFGRWWNPTVFGKPYFNKPPLKMWLSTIPVSVFGESTFSYRFLDALCGTLTLVLVYFFSLSLFRSPLGAVVSVLSLLGAKAYMFFHVVRSANQDSMLVLLVTAAMFVAWTILRQEKKGERIGPGRVVLFGLLCGLGALTKNVAGFIPFILAGVYIVLSWRWRLSLLLSFAAAAVIAVALPALYLLPHCFPEHAACTIMLEHEVINRVSTGYHHIDDPFFYFDRMFRGRMSVPPELCLLSIAAAIWFWRRNKDNRFLLLLTWTAVPYIMFSAVPSRNEWYITPALPGAAMLCGAAVSALFFKYRSGRQGTLATAAMVLFFSVAVFSIGYQLKMVTRKLIWPKEERLAMETIVREIKNFDKPAAVYGDFLLAKNEIIYLDMLRDHVTVNDLTSLKELLRANALSVVFVPSGKRDEVEQAGSYNLIKTIPPHNKRLRKVYAFYYGRTAVE